MPVEGYSNADWRAAGFTDEGTYNPTQLFTAEDEVKSAAGTFKTNTNLAVLTIIARDSNNLIVQWDPSQSDERAQPIGVSAADMDTTVTGYNAATVGPYMVGGCFNPDLLVWPSALSSATHEEQSGALEAAAAPFRVKHLL